MKHGGDLLSYKDLYEGEFIDFSSNINPLGPPKALKEIIYENYHLVEAYPDIKYRKLKKSLSEYLKAPIKNILVGNGSMEIIDSLISKRNKLLVMTPAFSEYTIRARVKNMEIEEFHYEKDFKVDIKKLKGKINSDTILVLANPNNPTANTLKKEELLKIYKKIKEVNGYLVLDEAFYEFTNTDYDSVELFKEYNYENIGIIRAATKFFAIPALRLGYAIVDEKTKENIWTKSLSWNINIFADLAGRFIFKDKKYIKESREYVKREREYLLNKLEEIDWLKAYPSETNFILIKLLKYNEEEIFTFLAKRGILIRKCSSFKSLEDNHIRIAVKFREDNEKLIKYLKEI